MGTFQIDSTSHTIYDIKAQRTLPFRYGEISGYVLWSLLGLIVLGGAIYAGRRLMARYARKVRDIFRPAPPLPPPHRGHPSARNAPQPETLAERTPQTVLLGPDGHPAHLSGRTIRLRRDGDDL